MRPALKLLLNTPPVIPNALKPYLLSWHDAQRQMAVYYPLTNLVTNGNFASGTTGWTPLLGTITASGNVCEFTSTVATGGQEIRRTDIPTTTVGRVYCVTAYITAPRNCVVLLRIGGTDSTSTTLSAGVETKITKTVISASASAICVIYLDLVGSLLEIGDKVYIKNVMAYDLAANIGSGREPTAAEMDAILTADGTAYWDGARTVHCNPQSRYFWHDYSGNNRHMYLGNLGYAALSTLSSANGGELDGVDDYMVIPDSAATRLATGGTLCAWIYPIGLGEAAGGRIFDKGTSTAAANGFFLCVSTDNVLRFYVNAGAAFTDSANNAITLNKWQQATVTFDSTGRHLYVNGMDVTASGGTTTALPPDVAGVVTIGNRAGATDRTFNGYIDRPMIFNRVLSQAEVMALYRGSRRRYGV